VGYLFGLPINVLPFVIAISMIVMMRMSPSAGDPMQQKIMKFMPVLFFLFCYTYPSALALYWTTTNIISIIQTLIIRRLPQPTLEEAKQDAKGGKKKEGFFARIQRMAEEQQRALEEQKRNGGMRNVTKKKK
jgi:YidC/Oxa1 family membrane protein insertase